MSRPELTSLNLTGPDLAPFHVTWLPWQVLDAQFELRDARLALEFALREALRTGCLHRIDLATKAPSAASNHADTMTHYAWSFAQVQPAGVERCRAAFAAMLSGAAWPAAKWRYRNGNDKVVVQELSLIHI